MTIINYSYNFITNFIEKNKELTINNDKIIEFFKEIRNINVFNPKKYVKKFNYTNWRNSISKEDETNKNIDDITIEKIKLLLNKISKKTFDLLSKKIFQLISDNKKYLDSTIEILFIYAINSDLCFNLNKKFGDNIKNKILDECKKKYKNYNNSINLAKKNDNELDEYDLLCKINKIKKTLIGIFNFIGSLYNKKLVDDIVIWKYLELLYQNLEETNLDIEVREKYIACLKSLIINVGKSIQNNDKEKFENQCLSKIRQYQKDKKFNNKEKFMFMDIIELFE